MVNRLFPGVFLLLIAGIAGCQWTPWVPVNVLSPETARVAQALAAWPRAATDQPAIKRTFFVTIHVVGHRTTASGILEYHSPRDFRITAVTEMGVILFDARMNWAGVTVLREMPGLDKAIVASLVGDMSMAFDLPDSLAGLEMKGSRMMLRRAGADGNKYTWTFDAATGRLIRTQVDLGAFDTLRIDYLTYTDEGWPEELTLTRDARFYQINLTFTNGSIARAASHLGP